MGRPKIEGIEEQELRFLHDEERMSISSLAEYFGVSRGAIYNRMANYGIKARSIRKYSVNEDFFKSWTRESAWVYGWVIGDGTLAQNKFIGIRLSRIDREVLFKIREAMESEHLVKDYKVWNEEYLKYIYMSLLHIYSKELCEDYLNLSYFEVPREHFSHFLRGFWEAEGSIVWNQNKIRISIAQKDKVIIDFILFTLRFYGIVRGGSLGCYNGIWQLSFSTNDSIRLYDYIYDDCKNMFLNRKKEKFRELVDKKIYGLN